MRILVTGSSGYIGSVVTPMLMAAGHDVTGLDSGLFDECTFTGESACWPTLMKDLRDVTMEDLKGFEAVVHLAALCNDPLGDLDPALTYEINYRSPVRIAALSREAGVSRFLVSSSCSLYGASSEDAFLDERAGNNPVTPYGRSKILMEEGIAELATPGFSPVFLRNATAYGVSPRLRLDIVLNELVASAVTTGRILMRSDGTPWRPIVHIEDIGRAFLAVIEAPPAVVHNEAFNVGRNEENYRIGALAEMVKQIVPGCEIEIAPGAGPDKRCYRVDCSKLRRTLPGFTPQWDARKGAQQLYEAFRDGKLTADHYAGPRFRRLLHVTELQRQGRLDSSLRWRAAAFAASPAC